MTNLSKKSSENISASTVLSKSGFYASSIHCSYYAVFQHLTCLLNSKLNLSFEEIIKNSKGPGSHDYVISNTFSFLNKNIKETDRLAIEVEKTNIQKIRKKIADLKLLRVQSDYHNVIINNDKCDKAINFSQEIIHKINLLVA